MTNETLFSGRAESYVEGRQGYAPGVMELLQDKILKPGFLIADVGSGTGIFAQGLLQRGFRVFCVEPNEDMRKQGERILGGSPGFVSVAASAESTGLPSGSIDLVTAASSFHWFDTEKFCLECKRILKPGAFLFTVANGRDYADPFTCRQHELCLKYCPGFVSLRHGLERAVPLYGKIFGNTLEHVRFDFPLRYTKKRFVQRSLSSSYAPPPESGAYWEYIREMESLLELFAPGADTILIPNTTEVYWGKLLCQE